MSRVLTPVHVLLILALVGCGGGDGPVLPGNPEQGAGAGSRVQHEVQSNRYLLGMWEVEIDPGSTEATIVPIRAVGMHLNIVQLLEVNPCSTCLTIEGIYLEEPNLLHAHVTLTHPFPGVPGKTGFDVRGIFISEGNYTFPIGGRRVAWGTGVPVVLNADGYTELFNPAEYPPAEPVWRRYIPGESSTGGNVSATLNPFLAYRRDAPRRMFEADGSETRTIRLLFPPGQVHFGYAVDACWQLVPHEIVDPLVEFPPDANCLEAYQITVDLPWGLEPEPGSEVPVSVVVSDHQGIDTISSVTIEAPDLFQGTVPLSFSGTVGQDNWLFKGTISNMEGAPTDTYPLLVRVVDTELDQNLGPVNAWFLNSVEVGRGWARTWGGLHEDSGRSVVVDGSGNSYVTGYFTEYSGDLVDLDPGAGVDNHMSNGLDDAFLSKFDSGGDFLWVRTWGGVGYDGGISVGLDGSGNVYATGFFQVAVDLDPGAGVDDHISNGGSDVFLSKFDSGGSFLWARTWGGGCNDHSSSVAVDGSGSAYVAGDFSGEGPTDFDPGPGVDNHTSSIWPNAFLSKFDSCGNFLWARTWGGYNGEDAESVALDGSGNAYVTGVFGTTPLDFDPGAGVDNHVSNGAGDAFLSKFDSGGNYLWARTWGGTDYDVGFSVVLECPGNAYVAGYFSATADFDPGAGVDYHVSNGSDDVSLSKFDSGGDFLWARTWGGPYGDDVGRSVAVDGSGNAYVAGYYYGTADLDPGPGVDYHTYGGRDAFLSKFDSSGSLLWACTWQGIGNKEVSSVGVDGFGNAYVTGGLWGTVDFNPGAGVDYHTANWQGGDAFLSMLPPDGNW